MTLLMQRRVLGAKAETVVGTPVALTAADAAMNVFDSLTAPGNEMTERPQQGSFARLPYTVNGLMQTVTFRTELHGDGAGGVPLWAATLLPACGFVDDGAGLFSAVTSAPGSNGVTTVTIGEWIDGKYFQTHGAQGSFTITIPVNGNISFNWTFTGIYTNPSDVPVPSPTYPTNMPFKGSNATVLYGGAAISCFEEATFDAGNNVVMRPCQTSASGYVSGLITDRLPVGTMNPEAVLVGTQDRHGSWTSNTPTTFSYQVEDTTDRIVIQTAGSDFQITDIQPLDREGIYADDISFGILNDGLQIDFKAVV